MFDTHNGFTVPDLVISTAGAGQPGLSYPLAPTYSSATAKLMRVNLFLQALTAANIQVEVCIQLSDDTVTWPSSTTAPQAGTSMLSFATAITRSAEGGTTITAFEDISSLLTKPYFRLVLWVKNIGGNQALTSCLASVRVERRSC